LICIPVKRLARAKSRLEALLGPDQRRRLVLAMLADVLAAARAVVEPGRCMVVGADPEVADLAGRLGAAFLRDPGRGLNAALRHAAARAAAAGAAWLLVLPGDVPAATPADLARLLAEDADVVVVPARAGDGTGALLLRPPQAIAFRFGPGSCRAHVAEAAARHLAWRLLPVPALAQDVDRPQDLLALAAPGPETARLVREIRSARR
jgi:2-phospho-L-lactate guanylyltransferase